MLKITKVTNWVIFHKFFVTINFEDKKGAVKKQSLLKP